MSTKEDGGAAFPQIKTTKQYSTDIDVHSVGGMTLRDYFAAKAMQSAQADPVIVMILGPKPNADRIAEYAYQVADAMLAARGESK